MANTCITDYTVEGDKEQLQKLYDMMKELQEMKDPGLVENGYGSTWLGNLVTKLGGDWKKVYCRGEWMCLELSPERDTLTYMTETAWSEMSEVRQLLKEKFPGLKFWYISEEGGCEYYVTNRPEDMYYLEIDSSYADAETLEDAIRLIEEATGEKGLQTLEECEAALARYSEGSDDASYIYKYEYVDD